LRRRLPTGDAGHDGALFSAKSLLLLLNSPNAPAFGMSDPTNYATISGMLGAITAWETANPGSTGITQQVHDAILGLCETTSHGGRPTAIPRRFPTMI
jgi:hypothetical protein